MFCLAIRLLVSQLVPFELNFDRFRNENWTDHKMTIFVTVLTILVSSV